MTRLLKNSFTLALLGALLAISRVPVCAQVTFTTLHSFTNAEGAGPDDTLTLGSDGNFYGTMQGGGAHGTGAIIRVTLSGAVTTLYSFSAYDSNLHNTDGASPYSGLVEGTDGDFYGATFFGGENGNGTLFKVTPSGTLTVLHTFSALASDSSNADGAHPQGLLAEGGDGNFYGMATQGGANRVGTFYHITPGGQFTTLHAFMPSEGVSPEGLISGSDGNFYGVANGGENPVVGTAFKVTSTGAVTVLHSFAGRPSDGAFPYGALTEGVDGNFYGTTQQGGTNGTGTVFKMTPSGTVTILHSFAAYNNGTQSNADGADIYAALVQASDGNFYGTAQYGGTNNNGTLYKITPGGTFTLLHTFSAFTSGEKNSDGAVPFAGLIEGSDFNLYGITAAGGQNGIGTLFQLNVGLTPPPILNSVHPGSVNASGPGFTLIVKGNAFLNTSTVNWVQGTSTTALTTTFVSATELKASVPASMIATAKKVKISVSTPSAGTSNLKPFTVKLTTLKLTGVQLSRNSSTGDITANLTIKNVGFLTAANATLTKSTLGPKLSAVATTSTLPLSLGSIAAGATVQVTLTYPSSAGTTGQIAYLKANTKFTGGASGLSFKVVLP